MFLVFITLESLGGQPIPHFLKLPPAEIREAVITLAIPTAAMAVILAVQFKIAEQEMASSLLFSTVLSVPTMGAFMFLTA
jgi:predicted permease